MIVVDEEDSRTAAHEAGHVLLMWDSSAVVRFRSLVRMPKDVRIRCDYAKPWLEKHAWDGIVIAAGGMAAEKLTFVDFEPWHCKGDLECLRVSIQGLQKDQGGLLPMPPWPEAAAAHAPAFERFFKIRLPLGYATIMTWAYRRALDLLGERLTPLRKLHELLLGDIQRSHDEIAAVLGPRPTFA